MDYSYEACHAARRFDRKQLGTCDFGIGFGGVGAFHPILRAKHVPHDSSNLKLRLRQRLIGTLVAGWRTAAKFLNDPNLGAGPMRFIKTVALIVLATLAVSVIPVRSQETDAQDAEMQKKLEYSKQILDGLVTEDFDKILKGAKSLNEFGKRKWIENDSLAYRTQNQVFWFTTGALVMAAEEKNIDSATLSYTQMTHSCVNCHKTLRRQ